MAGDDVDEIACGASYVTRDVKSVISGCARYFVTFCDELALIALTTLLCGARIDRISFTGQFGPYKRFSDVSWLSICCDWYISDGFGDFFIVCYYAPVFGENIGDFREDGVKCDDKWYSVLLTAIVSWLGRDKCISVNGFSFINLFIN